MWRKGLFILKRKLIFAFLVLLVFVGCFSFNSLAQLKGDLDNDGSITSLDVTRLRRYLVGMNDDISMIADMNSDDFVDSLDFTLLRREILGGNDDSGDNNDGDNGDGDNGDTGDYNVPGTIEAEDYLQMEGIEIEDCTEGGQNIGYLDNGDWMTYRINVAEAGDYIVEYRVASEADGGAISFDGLETIDIPNTGGWQTWRTISHVVNLPAGEQEIRISITSSQEGAGNINWIRFSKDDGSGDNDDDEDSGDNNDDDNNDNNDDDDTGDDNNDDTGDTGVGPVGYYGEMEVSGNRIHGSKTDSPMQVKGMSFFWSNWSSEHYNSSMVDRMVDEFKVEIIRAAYGVDDEGSPYDGNEAIIEDLVDAAIDQGIYVIIDWHSHGAHYNPTAAKDFFGRMAQKYGQYDNVIFEIYNEPLQEPWSEIKNYAEEVIPVIREHSDNLIIVGTTTWSQDVDQAANNPVNADNIAYTLHFYAGTHGQFLRDKADSAMNNGIALFATEWGTVDADGDGSVNFNGTEDWLSWMDQNKISWCNWSVHDKDEGASIFLPGMGGLSDSGSYLKEILNNHADSAPWR